MKVKRLVPLCVVPFALLACSESPTAPTLTPPAALRDGGLGLGSGNHADTTTTKSTASGEETATGGLGLGSGN